MILPTPRRGKPHCRIRSGKFKPSRVTKLEELEKLAEQYCNQALKKYERVAASPIFS